MPVNSVCGASSTCPKEAGIRLSTFLAADGEGRPQISAGASRAPGGRAAAGGRLVVRPGRQWQLASVETQAVQIRLSQTSVTAVTVRRTEISAQKAVD